MKVNEKLLQVQTKLKAPKGRENTFGKYAYRSCEDILEAVKPLLAEVKAYIKLTDQIMQIGDRYYVNATAWFVDCENEGEMISADAFAREDDDKKGMQPAQLSGATSSYARKYALGGLLLVDDQKDFDTDEFKKETDARAGKAVQKPKKKDNADDLDKFVTDAQLKTLEMLLERANVPADKFNSIFKLTVLSELPADKYDDAVHKLEEAIKIKEKGDR
ncbi:MAG: ERF family protein [Clostridia bacterium]|nr:ERF family protein [Clostridia bacterium]